MDVVGKPLFIFELANNHQGSVEHGKRIISALKDVVASYNDDFLFAVKFQYRDLDTFIHPAMKGRKDVQNVKRFEETRLSSSQFAQLLDSVRKNGFLAICTPFDEISARRIKEEGYDFIKIASCSFGDWPLMEAVAETGLPVIASAAGVDMDTVGHVVSFLKNRNIPMTLMHCIGEYPTPNDHMQLNQIDLYRTHFPHLTIGFSTHESPDNTQPIRMAVAKGAQVFERHVGIEEDGVPLNGYSSNPDQIRAWLAAAAEAFTLCGIKTGRYVPSKKERSDLEALRRGVFAGSSRLSAGTGITVENVSFAFPSQPGQLCAQDFSKYNRIVLLQDIEKGEPIMRDHVEIRSTLGMVQGYMNQVIGLLRQSNATVPEGSSCEISHHYGLEHFRRIGLVLITCVNRGYCKKLLVMLPGQSHPDHYHKRKEETFLVVQGDLTVEWGNQRKTIRRGETLTIEPGVWHNFQSDEGCVFEELSSTHFTDDSYYRNQKEFVVPRKTTLFLTRSLLE